ncbi:MAG TPA: hypothetical protein VGX23_00075 [Actinocrinis sp.]|nr:hypothetical protein [Actinocrinis sp.]
MSEASGGVLALMGSGETSPTMVTAHQRLAARLGPAPSAVILETPYGFQVNTVDISRRAREYFQRSVGLATVVAAEPDPSDGPGCRRAADQVRAADWVFTGPGSPSYALGRWAAVHLGEALAERLRRRAGVTVLASAAACTAGFAALPVYEIYKAGRPPHWLDGLDLLGGLGLPVAVIPHYDNAEGGTYDTRFCYLGETRLSALAKRLPQGSAVLGIDEHTSVIIDLALSEVQVWGRGAVTVRRGDASTVLPSGSVFPLAHLQDLVHGTAKQGAHSADAATVTSAATIPGPTSPADRATGPVPLQQAVADARQAFAAAELAADADAMVEAVLGLESTIAAWAMDTEEDQGTDWARDTLRELIQRLAEPAARGLIEPERTLQTLAGPLVDLRATFREQGAYDLADRVRDLLCAAGVVLRDTGRTTLWQLAGTQDPDLWRRASSRTGS